jgi:photosystem II stability/assembly factor-like uncharacterized protein
MGKSRWLSGLAALTVTAAALHHTAPAHANGRYPQAMQLAQDPTNPKRLWLRATYGMVTSNDGGETWSLVCEEGLGMDSNGVFDPMFGVHADGSISIGLMQGLKRTTDHGCDWQHVVPELEKTFVQDIAVDARDRRRALAISSYGTESSYVTELWETQNNGASYARVTRLEADHFARTLDAAPSNPNRVYLSVMFLDPSDIFIPGVPAMLISNDRGKNWTRVDLPVPPDSDPYIAAVHPTNADVLYVRTHQTYRADGSSAFAAKSRLLLSENGGTTWREILSGDAPMLGFALSPDASEVLVGFGDDGDPRRPLVAPESAFGIWRAATSDFDFQRVYDRKVGCLYWTANDIYVCSRLDDAGFDLGLFNNTCPATIRPLFNKRRMTGILACAAETSTAQGCTEQVYKRLCDQKLYCSLSSPGVDGGPSCWEGGSYEGGTNDASPSFDSGVGGAAGDASVAGDGGTPRSRADSDSGGCSCRHARRDARISAALLGAAIAVALGRRRRARAA